MRWRVALAVAVLVAATWTGCAAAWNGATFGVLPLPDRFRVNERLDSSVLGGAFTIHELVAEEGGTIHTATLFTGDSCQAGQTGEMAPYLEYFRANLMPAQQMDLNALNMNLFNAEAELNQFIRERFSAEWVPSEAPPEVRKKMLAAVRVRVRDVEPVQRVVGTSEIMYRSGARLELIVDGFSFPYYWEAYAVRRGNGIAVLGLFVRDAERALFRDELAAAVKALQKPDEQWLSFCQQNIAPEKPMKKYHERPMACPQEKS